MSAAGVDFVSWMVRVVVSRALIPVSGYRDFPRVSDMREDGLSSSKPSAGLESSFDIKSSGGRRGDAADRRSIDCRLASILCRAESVPSGSSGTSSNGTLKGVEIGGNGLYSGICGGRTCVGLVRLRLEVAGLGSYIGKSLSHSPENVSSLAVCGRPYSSGVAM